MNNPKVAFVIRTKNEERWIGEVLQRIFSQTYENIEVVVVDSGSTDRTLDIVRQYPVRVYEILPEDFSYPYALNYGIEQTSQNVEYIVLISGHSLPVGVNWLRDGMSNFYDYERVAGVYGPLKSLPDATFWDKLYQAWLPWFALRRRPRRIRVRKDGMGVLGFTNAIILKKLWSQHPFDEAYGAGGEDGEWARYWLSRGYQLVWDKRFMVQHSHYLSFWGWIQQRKVWASLGGPRPFQPLSFRKDGAHNT